MASDKHYTEPGTMPHALEDRKGTDAEATKGMVVVIAVITGILLIAGLIIYFQN